MEENQILEAITRSGYLFESEVSKYLSDRGLFVESNVIFQDPVTNKNREIDIVAQTSYNADILYNKNIISSRIRYYLELKNNEFPLVLLTKIQFNPSSPVVIYKSVLTVPDQIDYRSNITFQEKLFNFNHNYYTQYCSFTKKKNNELMATHPIELYSSLSKLCWYCEKTTVETQEELKNEYFRQWLHVPVLLINNDSLYELNLTKGKPKLEKVKYSRLLLNFHFNDLPTSTVIYVITKNYFSDWLDEMDKIESKVREKMLECMKSSQSN